MVHEIDLRLGRAEEPQSGSAAILERDVVLPSNQTRSGSH